MKKMITLMLGIIMVTSTQATIYVASGSSGDGSSWATAMGDIQSAVNAAQVLYSSTSTPQNVWVKAGTYSTATASILMKEGVNLYGGFAGTETELSQRAKGVNPWDYTNVTTLDGGAAKRCIEVSANFASVYVIDGFTITNGNGQGTQLNNSGGGVVLRSNLKLQNCIVTGNTTSGNGGGINSVGGIVSNCLVYSNATTSATVPSAGGIYAAPAAGYTSVIENSVIEQNAQGGVRIQSAGTTTLNNLIIRNNTSTGAGAGIYTNNPGSCTITNCLITNNSGNNTVYLNKGTMVNSTIANNEGIMYLASATNIAELYNNIIVGNVAKGTSTAVSISVVANYPAGKVKFNAAWPGVAGQSWGDGSDSILTTDAATAYQQIAFNAPVSFVGATTDAAKITEIKQANWKLTAASLAINAGENSYVPATVTTDLAGLDRVVGTKIDLGAYELPQGTTSFNPSETSTVRVATSGRQVQISGLSAGEQVLVYSISGAVMQSVKTSSERISMELGQGMYIVKTKGISHKIVVR